MQKATVRDLVNLEGKRVKSHRAGIGWVYNHYIVGAFIGYALQHGVNKIGLGIDYEYASATPYVCQYLV